MWPLACDSDENLKFITSNFILENISKITISTKTKRKTNIIATLVFNDLILVFPIFSFLFISNLIEMLHDVFQIFPLSCLLFLQIY